MAVLGASVRGVWGRVGAGPVGTGRIGSAKAHYQTRRSRSSNGRAGVFPCFPIALERLQSDLDRDIEQDRRSPFPRRLLLGRLPPSVPVVAVDGAPWQGALTHPSTHKSIKFNEINHSCDHKLI
jgi:hypothetical protein